jgi:DNA polymerase-3 subunit epsilon
MAHQRSNIWLVAVSAITITIVCFGGVSLFFWHQLSVDEQTQLAGLFDRHFIYFFSGFILVLAGFGIALDGIIHIYVLPVRRLAEETALMHSVNPSHRIHPVGSQDVKSLTRIINDWANRFEELEKNVGTEIAASKSDLEREKNILAAFMAELPQGVLVCNIEGRILLYNKRAKEMFAGDRRRSPESADGAAFGQHRHAGAEAKLIGLGRSIFSIIDKNLIVHALDEIAAKSARNEAGRAAYFVVAGSNGNLMRAEAVPINTSLDRLTGVVLLFTDITAQLEKDHRVEMRMRSLITGVRASVGGLRSAIETVLAYPDMNQRQLDQFRHIIHKESLILGELADKADADCQSSATGEWPLVPMLAKDLARTIAAKAREKLAIRMAVAESADNYWIRVDSYSIVLAMLFVLRQLSSVTGVQAFSCRLAKNDRFVHFELDWAGSPVKIDTLRQWDGSILTVGDEGLPLTLKEVIQHHEAGIWSYASRETQARSHIRFFLPAARSPDTDAVRKITIFAEESRPVFYDFDLFGQHGVITDLDDRPLSELTYSVFDTETTGLDPRGGDEILSIGAVRILNGHLLHEEIFDQLIDPQRQVPQESIRIHGIEPEMLAGQPTIAAVLPQFHRFCSNTVLVAHNAAFDMLMLQLKEASTGIRFLNPVLDTLLLSDVLMPTHKRHDIETIARRLGISVVGRHTALGDAIATAEIFLKMVPMLNKMGIFTLKEAQSVCRRSRYHRLKY